MKMEPKRIVFTGSFFNSGYSVNLAVDDTNALAAMDCMKRGIWFSAAFDSMSFDMTFHRLVLDCNLPEDSSLQIRVRTSNDKFIAYQGKLILMDDFLADQSIELTERFELFSGENTLGFQKNTDMLLHGLSGRYLWICLTIGSARYGNIRVRSISLEFPRHSFVDYLPEVYQQNADFLRRYIGIFQSIYLDMERKIDRLPIYLDPDTVPDEYLDYLASWMGVGNEGAILDPERLRYMVRNSIRLNKIKGTVQSIVEMVKLYTGKTPYVVEYFKLQQFSKEDRDRQKLFDRLYTDNPYVFCVIAGIEPPDRSWNRAELIRLIEKVKPAHTIARVVILERSVQLDMHSYLGMNSVLERPQMAKIGVDGKYNGNYYLGG